MIFSSCLTKVSCYKTLGLKGSKLCRSSILKRSGNFLKSTPAIPSHCVTEGPLPQKGVLPACLWAEVHHDVKEELVENGPEVENRPEQMEWQKY